MQTTTKNDIGQNGPAYSYPEYEHITGLWELAIYPGYILASEYLFGCMAPIKDERGRDARFETRVEALAAIYYRL